MATILLVRHGETDWNVQRRVQGHSDTPLNATGRAQAEELARTLEGEPIDAVYSSDLERATATAAIVAKRLGLDVKLEPALREKHFGTWEGLTDTEVFERFPEAQPGRWGDGETSEEMSERVIRAIERIAGHHPDGRALVVTHDGPVRALLRACGEPGDFVANCHVCAIEVRDGLLRAVD